MKSISCIHLFYEKDLIKNIKKINNFFSITDSTYIFTIGSGSKINVNILRFAFPKAKIKFVENEFYGYKFICDFLGSNINNYTIFIANDTLGRHWELTPLRKMWLNRSLRRAEDFSSFIIFSEFHRGRKKKFPGSAAITAWFTSNYFVTNSPMTLSNSLNEAIKLEKKIPKLFRIEGVAAIKKLFTKRKILCTNSNISSKLARTWLEMLLYKFIIREPNIKIIYASRGRSLLNLFHKLFFDK